MPAPLENMSRGSATTDGKFAYFTPRGSSSVYRYEWQKDKWEELPSCPHSDSSLVVINRELTAVGGLYGPLGTNRLVTLRQRKWVEKYPPMSSACSSPAVAIVHLMVSIYIIVIGGFGGYSWTTTSQLNILQVKSKRWFKLTDLYTEASHPPFSHSMW